MNLLIFDVESTGLLPTKPSDKSPYITQLSFVVYNLLENKLIKRYNAYIQIPESIEISEKITQITGISREILDEKGIDITIALEQLYDAYCRADIVVAHNLDFDSKLIEIETKRNYNRFENKENNLFILWMFGNNEIYKKLTNIQMKCSMKMSIDLCNIERINSNGIYKKFPTLCELYEKLFHIKPENLHNSMIDVLVCLRCYLKMEYNILIEESAFLNYIESVL